MARDPEESLRLFFALPLPEESRQGIVELQERLRPSETRVKWVERENLHITLKFLGATPALMVPDLRQVGQAVAAEIPPFQLALQGVDAFPRLSRPQTLVIRTGVGTEELTELATVLHRRLDNEALLVDAQRKGFVAHCTFGRVKQERGLGRLVAALEDERDFRTEQFWAESFSLYRSELTGDGPVYTEAARFALGG